MASEIVFFLCCDSGGTQTRDTQNRNLMLYSTELRSLGFLSLAKLAILLYKTKASQKKIGGPTNTRTKWPATAAPLSRIAFPVLIGFRQFRPTIGSPPHPHSFHAIAHTRTPAAQQTKNRNKLH